MPIPARRLATLPLLAISLIPPACTSPSPDDTGQDTGSSSTAGDPSSSTAPSTESASSNTTAPETTVAPTDSSSTDDPSATSSGSESTTTDGPADSSSSSDTGLDPLECDPWAQDCSDNRKCVPFASDGGDTYDSTQCVDENRETVSTGDLCTVEGALTSGIDDCRVGVICWDVDEESSTGACTPLCAVSEDDPYCEDPGTSCQVIDGLFGVCVAA